MSKNNPIFISFTFTKLVAVDNMRFYLHTWALGWVRRSCLKTPLISSHFHSRGLLSASSTSSSPGSVRGSGPVRRLLGSSFTIL